MCKWGNWKSVEVKIPADLSATGKAKWKIVDIDACIAPIVAALQKAEIETRCSCCGHGKSFGSILLQDGRELVIVPNKWFIKPFRFLWEVFKYAVRAELLWHLRKRV